MKKVLKILLIIVIVLVILRIVNYLSVNINYLKDKHNYEYTFNIYGTTNNNIPQGLAYSDKYNIVLQTSYNKKHKVSKLYISDFNSKKLLKEFNLKNIDNSINNSHVGGISTDNNKLWITNDYSIDEFNLEEIINSNSKYIKPIKNTKISIRGDFCTYYDNNLYVGEFALKPFYNPTNEDPIMIKYNIDNYNEEEYYSLPKMVQGVVIDNNQFIFVRSYTHFTRSYLNYYEKINTSDSFNNKKYYHFNEDNLVKKIKIPPMAEGMFYKDNHLYILFESNADRYFYAIPKIKKVLKIKK